MKLYRVVIYPIDLKSMLRITKSIAKLSSTPAFGAPKMF